MKTKRTLKQNLERIANNPKLWNPETVALVKRVLATL